MVGCPTLLDLTDPQQVDPLARRPHHPRRHRRPPGHRGGPGVRRAGLRRRRRAGDRPPGRPHHRRHLQPLHRQGRAAGRGHPPLHQRRVRPALRRARLRGPGHRRAGHRRLAPRDPPAVARPGHPARGLRGRPPRPRGRRRAARRTSPTGPGGSARMVDGSQGHRPRRPLARHRRHSCTSPTPSASASCSSRPSARPTPSPTSGTRVIARVARPPSSPSASTSGLTSDRPHPDHHLGAHHGHRSGHPRPRRRQRPRGDHRHHQHRRDRGDPHRRGQRRRHLHVGLREGRPPGAQQALREGQARAVERRDRPRLVDRRRSREGHQRAAGLERGRTVPVDRRAPRLAAQELRRQGVDRARRRVAELAPQPVHARRAGRADLHGQDRRDRAVDRRQVLRVDPGDGRGPPRRGLRQVPAGQAHRLLPDQRPPQDAARRHRRRTAAGT